ncbi:MAG: TIGR03560 family F420-dependent LLM class oxidoreductase [Candidatus Dormibacteraceae bacterium]
MSTQAQHFGLKMSGQNTTIADLRAVWKIGDQAGFDHLWDFDHYASIGPGGPDRPVFEGWALQAAMAEATEHVRIGCNVTGNTYRSPVQLAKLATTVDHLSGGRLEFGIGAAWAEIEHRMYGWEGLDHRVGRLSESLRIITALWSEERVTFEGRYYQLHDAIANPKPVQQPHPPIWIGAGGEQMLKLVARYADVWNPTGAARENPAEAWEKVQTACRAIGRDPGEIRRASLARFGGGGVAELIQDLGAAIERGFTEHMIYLPEQDGPHAANLIAEALPRLRALGA